MLPFPPRLHREFFFKVNTYEVVQIVLDLVSTACYLNDYRSWELLKN